MTKSYKALAAFLMTAAAVAVPFSANALGWPANYEGVMLQGFYWDSYQDSKWTKLESQADELSKYFKLIWIPNSGKCGSGNNMGYMPQYWFTNHNSSFGTEAELLSMIQTYKEKGTGFIADCVINHRNGVTNWYDFPKEQWNGQTWSIGLDGICKNDEMANASGQPKPTGAYDTGDNFDGCRDLDHTNANVQNNCKNYVKCLKEKYGYVGMRYDMVKGYGGQYNKIYNTYADVEYSVGEYWDSNYNAVAGWIEATGKTSAAFDFPCKYAINEAFSSGDMTKLVWLANGNNPQPAGMIHFGYPQYSVTFVDNHDTYRDGSKFNGNVVAANAFILFSPGTPCVFLRHYLDNKAAIQKLIDLRNEVGISNTSKVTVLKSASNCYMAEVTGSNGKAVVKIGPSMDSAPASYGSPKTYGTDYCVWTTTDGGDDDDVTAPANLYLLGNLSTGSWSTSAGVAMTKEGNKFVAKNVKLVASTDGSAYFTFATTLGVDWDAVNGADRYGATTKDEALSTSAPMKKFAVGVDASSAYSWKVAPGTYNVTADFSTMTVTISDGEGGGGDDDDIPADMPDSFYVLGEVNGKTWAYNDAVPMKKSGHEFIADVEIGGATGTVGYYSFCKKLGSTWDALNVAGNRYAPAADTSFEYGNEPLDLMVCTNPAQAKAYNTTNGKYTLVVDWKNKKIRLEKNGYTGIESVDFDLDNAPVRWFNLQGVEVSEPTHGVYIRIQGGKTTKVVK